MSRAAGASRPGWTAAGWAAVALFAILVLRFWHPVYGFTRFLQLDAADEATAIAGLRGQPVYVYRNTGGYDGQYYAQIAYHPLLNAPELKTAVDNLNYRARRILPPAIAWVLAGGRGSQIARVYAWLNVACWLALAVLCWRILPVRDAKSFVAWVGILFSAGALTSVRFALTDLIAATLTVSAMGGARRQGARGGERAGWGQPAPPLALAALCRETALLALPGMWTKPWWARKNLIATAVAVIPLSLWLAYIRLRLGPGDPGLNNFTWPLLGWANKWLASIQAVGGPVDFALTASTLLAVAGLTVQAIYLLAHPRTDEPWWRVGIAYLVLLTVLGHAVWENFPGAAFRVVLPLTIGCNLLMARNRAGWGWLLAANLGVAAGLVALAQVPDDPQELSAASAHGKWAVVREGSGWFGAEHTARHRWAWAGGPATLSIEGWPRAKGVVHCALELRSVQARRLAIRQGDRLCWSGTVGPVKTAAAWDIDLEDGHALLQLASDGPAVRESADIRSRALAFAVYDLKVSFPDAGSASP
jgi:hypothetical protein